MTLLELTPTTRAAGTVDLPGSKSISNRVLLLAALSEGSTRIDGLLDSDDTRVMLTALETLGIALERVAPGTVVVHGRGGRFAVRQAELFLGNAGTAFRPLTAALALSGGHYTLSGVPRMHERPIGDLVDALAALGCDIRCLANPGYPPLAIAPAQLKGEGEPLRVRGDVSSQFLTALLLAAPLLARERGMPTEIEVVGELISKPYVDITLNLLARFGIAVERQGHERFRISATQYRSPGSIRVEGDASSASYFLALGLLGGGPVTVRGIDAQSIQGDIGFARFLEQSLGARLQWGEGEVSVSRAGAGRLPSFDRDFNDIPDAAMTAAVLALYADGPCTLRNIASWRVKETDRIAAMATELRKLGAEVIERPDSLTVTPPRAWTPAQIGTYDDHRMAMCFSLATFGGVSVTIEDPDCVRKTFPEYFRVRAALVS